MWKIKKRTKVGGSCVNAEQGMRYSLFIKGAATDGGRAVFIEGPCEFLVEMVRHRPRDSLPSQDEDHQHGTVAEVPRPLANQTQQLFLFTATPDYLSEDLQICTENK